MVGSLDKSKYIYNSQPCQNENISPNAFNGRGRFQTIYKCINEYILNLYFTHHLAALKSEY